MHPPQNTYFKMHLISMNIALHFSTSQNPLKTHPSLNHYIYIMKNTNTYPPPHDLLPFIPHNITSLPSLPTHIINFPLSPQHYTYRCFPLALIQGPLAPTTSLLVNHNLRPSLPSLPSFLPFSRERREDERGRARGDNPLFAFDLAVGFDCIAIPSPCHPRSKRKQRTWLLRSFLLRALGSPNLKSSGVVVVVVVRVPHWILICEGRGL
jgi:hypothetical protein